METTTQIAITAHVADQLDDVIAVLDTCAAQLAEADCMPILGNVRTAQNILCAMRDACRES